MAGYVYLIGTPKFQWYKIGKSKDASIRVRELGILLPFKIDVIAVWKAEDHHAMELLLHEKYIKNRINGEWFRFSAAHVRGICDDLRFAEVGNTANFTNMEKDVQQDFDGKYLDSKWGAKYSGDRMKSGLKYRLDKLTRENAELKRKLLDFGSFTVQ